mgnify:CR=1 FL=1
MMAINPLKPSKEGISNNVSIYLLIGSILSSINLSDFI